jgi:hypothetical protein
MDTQHKSSGHRRTEKPALAEPVIVREWKRNRHGETISARLVTFNEANLFDLRTWFIDEAGKQRPGKGFAASVHHLPELARALNEALAKAQELKLIRSEAE